MKNVLVIGYGNVLRRDDGAGRRAAERIAERFPDVECVSVHELHPELAEQAASKHLVLFLDAAPDIEFLQFRPVVPAGNRPVPLTHSVDPERLMLLCRHLFDAAPEAYLVKIPAVDMSFGEDLSPVTAAAVKDVVSDLGTLLFRQDGSGQSAPNFHVLRDVN